MALRYLGDVLVTTPLALSIKKAIPGARVEYLVFEGTEAVLAKNPYVDRVHVMPRGSRRVADFLPLLKKYDVAIGCNQSDRAAIITAVSGRISVALSHRRLQEWWSALLLTRRCQYHDDIQVVQLMLSLLEPLGIPKVPEVVAAYDRDDTAFASRLLPNRYVLLHPYSRGSYKYWPSKYWGELAELILAETALLPVFTLTGGADDARFLDEILRHAPKGCVTFPQPFTLPQVSAAAAGAAVFVGIDTIVTHLAAATGVPVLAIYGPTYTRYWAPWPKGCDQLSPFAHNRGIQRVGNVTVLQQDWPCVPCNAETCGENKNGNPLCLVELRPKDVFEQLLRCLPEEATL